MVSQEAFTYRQAHATVQHTVTVPPGKPISVDEPVSQTVFLVTFSVLTYFLSVNQFVAIILNAFTKSAGRFLQLQWQTLNAFF